ncbi:MAG TPA: glucuronate isomerase [Candidatus Methylacidiphilales bacterium]|nr:glucuronate isomerase [Candidatus Methylacidiphilales bacterium]
MKSFIHLDFLLDNEPARELYHHHAASQPIIDYHNHLSPGQIASNYQFGDLAEVWLAGDHYKWRAMRANGVTERFITGDASPEEKFKAWAATVPYTLRNPLYHWTHLELVRYFGIEDLLDASSADRIWREANAHLPSLRIYDILERHHVRILCTTDDPADSLDHHHAIRKSKLKTRVYPTFRPDKALRIQQPAAFNAWRERLEQVTGGPIQTFDDLLSALKKRHDEFHAAGCRASDHGLETCFASPCSHAQASQIFSATRAGNASTPEDCSAYASFLMLEFGRWNAARGWALQLHLGALRNNNRRMLAALGPDTGYDATGDFPQITALVHYLDALDGTGELPRVILYNLNPADNYAFASVLGSFQDGVIPGKAQLGSGWWFLDQKEGIEWQLNALSNLGLLRRFVGMVTDSRSFLSFPRHEYFRRVLCNLLGQGLVSGELPADMALIGKMVEEICFANARDYFGFELPPE